MPLCSHSAVFNGAGIYASGPRLAGEFTVKERNIEFKAVLAYEPRSSRCAGSNPRISGCQVRMVGTCFTLSPVVSDGCGRIVPVLSINRVGTAL